MDILTFMYDTGKERAAFGEHWCGPEMLPHFDEVLCATFDGSENNGRLVRVYISACPSRFYKIKAFAIPANAERDAIPGWTICTGECNGMLELVAALALQISHGMLDFEAEDK